MNMVHNIQYHQRKKNILKRWTLVYVEAPWDTSPVKVKMGCSIIPKSDAEKRQLLQRPNPNILPTILPKAQIMLCRRDYNRKGRLKSQGIFPNKSQPQPTNIFQDLVSCHQFHPCALFHLPYLPCLHAKVKLGQQVSGSANGFWIIWVLLASIKHNLNSKPVYKLAPIFKN